MYTTISVNVMQVKESKSHLVRTPQDVSECCSDMATMAQESFQVLTLNSKNKMLDRHMITLGILDATLVHPREVLKPCILDGAACYIAIHNHPSGDTTPSAEDIRMTKQLVDASKIMNIPILDHIIIAKCEGEVKTTSMREYGCVTF